MTAECAEHLATALDALTQPQPTAESGPDPRTATQRRHDAFTQILQLNARARLLPRAGGIATTVLLTMDADTWIRGQGSATTGHGYTLSAQTAKRWAGADTRLILTLLDKTKAVTAYSTGHRIFTEQQRLAIIARDRGCTFPGCDAGPQWCEMDFPAYRGHRHSGRSGHGKVSDGELHAGVQGPDCRVAPVGSLVCRSGEGVQSGADLDRELGSSCGQA